jgi:uncharacterized LabA/DUF88 family protein
MSKLSELPTYVYIDASNISNALRSLGIEIDYEKVYQYLENKYKYLCSVSYFEGVLATNWRKFLEMEQLENFGYEVFCLSRKGYTKKSRERFYRCSQCDHINKVVTLSEKIVYKSNIDVYLCAQLMSDILNKRKPVHVIIFSCDGDFADMIRLLLTYKENVYVSVFATPYVKSNNYLSKRLKDLYTYEKYHLIDITNFVDYIEKDGSPTEV